MNPLRPNPQPERHSFDANTVHGCLPKHGLQMHPEVSPELVAAIVRVEQHVTRSGINVSHPPSKDSQVELTRALADLLRCASESQSTLLKKYEPQIVYTISKIAAEVRNAKHVRGMGDTIVSHQRVLRLLNSFFKLRQARFTERCRKLFLPKPIEATRSQKLENYVAIQVQRTIAQLSSGHPSPPRTGDAQVALATAAQLFTGERSHYPGHTIEKTLIAARALLEECDRNDPYNRHTATLKAVDTWLNFFTTLKSFAHSTDPSEIWKTDLVINTLGLPPQSALSNNSHSFTSQFVALRLSRDAHSLILSVVDSFKEQHSFTPDTLSKHPARAWALQLSAEQRAEIETFCVPGLMHLVNLLRVTSTDFCDTERQLKDALDECAGWALIQDSSEIANTGAIFLANQTTLVGRGAINGLEQLIEHKRNPEALTIALLGILTHPPLLEEQTENSTRLARCIGKLDLDWLYQASVGMSPCLVAESLVRNPQSPSPSDFYPSRADPDIAKYPFDSTDPVISQRNYDRLFRMLALDRLFWRYGHGLNDPGFLGEVSDELIKDPKLALEFLPWLATNANGLLKNEWLSIFSSLEKFSSREALASASGTPPSLDPRLVAGGASPSSSVWGAFIPWLTDLPSDLRPLALAPATLVGVYLEPEKFRAIQLLFSKCTSDEGSRDKLIWATLEQPREAYRFRRVNRLSRSQDEVNQPLTAAKFLALLFAKPEPRSQSDVATDRSTNQAAAEAFNLAFSDVNEMSLGNPAYAVRYPVLGAALSDYFKGVRKSCSKEIWKAIAQPMLTWLDPELLNDTSFRRSFSQLTQEESPHAWLAYALAEFAEQLGHTSEPVTQFFNFSGGSTSARAFASALLLNTLLKHSDQPSTHFSNATRAVWNQAHSWYAPGKEPHYRLVKGDGEFWPTHGESVSEMGFSLLPLPTYLRAPTNLTGLRQLTVLLPKQEESLVDWAYQIALWDSARIKVGVLHWIFAQQNTGWSASPTEALLEHLMPFFDSAPSDQCGFLFGTFRRVAEALRFQAGRFDLPSLLDLSDLDDADFDRRRFSRAELQTFITAVENCGLDGKASNLSAGFLGFVDDSFSPHWKSPLCEALLHLPLPGRLARKIERELYFLARVQRGGILYRDTGMGLTDLTQSFQSYLELCQAIRNNPDEKVLYNWIDARAQRTTRSGFRPFNKELFDYINAEELVSRSKASFADPTSRPFLQLSDFEKRVVMTNFGYWERPLWKDKEFSCLSTWLIGQAGLTPERSAAWTSRTVEIRRAHRLDIRRLPEIKTQDFLAELRSMARTPHSDERNGFNNVGSRSVTSEVIALIKSYNQSNPTEVGLQLASHQPLSVLESLANLLSKPLSGSDRSLASRLARQTILRIARQRIDPDLLNIIENSKTSPEDLLAASIELIQDTLYVDGSPKDLSHLGALQQTQIIDLFPLAALQDDLARVLAADNVQVDHEPKLPLQFIPTHDHHLEFVGEISGSCLRDLNHIGLKYPNATCISINRTLANGTFDNLGAALLFETIAADGKKVLLLRSINPTYRACNTFATAHMVDELIEYVASLLEPLKAEYLLVPRDPHSGYALTNRPQVQFHFHNHYFHSAEPMPLLGSSDTAIKGLSVQDRTVIIRRRR